MDEFLFVCVSESACVFHWGYIFELINNGEVFFSVLLLLLFHLSGCSLLAFISIERCEDGKKWLWNCNRIDFFPFAIHIRCGDLFLGECGIFWIREGSGE